MAIKVNMKKNIKEPLDYFTDGIYFIYEENGEDDLYLKISKKFGNENKVLSYKFSTGEFVEINANKKVRIVDDVEINVKE